LSSAWAEASIDIGTHEPSVHRRLVAQLFGELAFVSKGSNEVVEGVARAIECSRWESLAPSLLEIGHGLPGGVEDLSALGRRKDQLCPAIGRIGLAFEVAETLEFVDEFRAGRQAQLGRCSQVGQSDAFGPDVPPGHEQG